jgi:HPr kinase/phosphorylase
MTDSALTKNVEILNVKIRKLTLPIRPGRNLAVIIEAAAANFRYSLISKVTPVDIISERIKQVEDKRNDIKDEREE